MIFSGINSIYAENVSKRKVLVQFRSDIRDNQTRINLFQDKFTCKVSPILPNVYSVKYNPKKFFEIQSKNLDYAQIQKTEEPLLRTFIFEFDKDINPKTIAKQLKAEYPEIETIAPYHIYKIQGFEPNDILFSEQKSLFNIKAPEAWEIWKGDPETIVCICDNGMNQDHEDLIDNIAINTGEIEDNQTDDDGNGYIDDYRGYNFYGFMENDWGNTFNGSSGHGTEVAGLAAADFNNGKGIAGVAGNCRLFPVRVAKGQFIEYGYDGIIYAASKHYSVLNLSWGGPQLYSDLEQIIINYAIANGVAIVASSGNIGTNNATRYDTFYPANYFGVLGVGEVDSDDLITTYNSTMGVQTDILAPGDGDFATNNWGDYQSLGEGTSYSSPIVAGAVALARSKYKSLTPLQAIEFVRHCTDDIIAINNGYSDLKMVPGRINLLKVVTTDPFSIPGIVPIEYVWMDEQGQKSSRFEVGDDVNLSINLTNYLADANNIKFTLSKVYDPMNSVEITQDIITLNQLNKDQKANIGNFQLKITKENYTRVIFRLDIQCNGTFSDFVKFDFIPTAKVTTFENENLKFSMADNGEFGYTEIGGSKEGVGFILKGVGNQLYGDSGLMMCEDESKVTGFDLDSYKPIKLFTNPSKNINIINDDYSVNPISVSIIQEVTFAHPNVAQIALTLQNISGKTLKDISLGYFYDWDIQEDPDSNVAVLYEEINNSQYANKLASLGAELVYKPNVDIYVGCVALSAEPNTTAQIAGLDYDYISDFTDERKIEVLNSGMSLQSDIVYDRSVFAGIKRSGYLPANTTFDIKLLIGADTNLENLTAALLNSIANNAVSEIKNDNFRIFADKNSNQITIYAPKDFGQIFDTHIYDLRGNPVQTFCRNVGTNPENGLTYQISDLPSQILIIQVNAGQKSYVQKVSWIE
ncbi:MAG: hypothetical protein A2X64_04485 [Ignavibacteria bacterium GWF2_33_9]|nr:MAG: hypothetical protein A2X64_04485 [Ignavibacteria bacterium GWF2_33_9]